MPSGYAIHKKGDAVHCVIGRGKAADERDGEFMREQFEEFGMLHA